MKDIRKSLKGKSWLGLVATVALSAHGADPLTLDRDVTVDVSEGETTTYATLDGGAYTLTKTGGGTLVFETLSNAAARIVVSAGTLDVRTAVPPKPVVLANAWLHLDATDLSTMAYTESNGIAYVSQWRDANGNGKILASGDASHKPFITQSFMNGRSVMDLGAIRHIGMAADAGYGAFFLFNSKCSTMREAFLVVGDTEDSKRSYVDYGKPAGYAEPRCTPLLGTRNLGSQTAPFFRTSIESFGGSRNSALTHANSLGATKCDWTLNGADVVNESTENLPDGINLVEIRAAADSGIEFDSLGTERFFYAGGLRYGEVAIFETALSAADRAAVRAYLSARWLPVDIAGRELGEGASLALANDVTLRVGSFKASGTASVTGSGVLKIVNVDRSGDGSLRFAQSAQTIRPDASGLLPDVSFPAGGSINAVGVDVRAGHVAVSGSFVKKGDGSLTVMDIDDGAALSVEEGAFVVDPQVATDNSWMHLDASVTNSSLMWLGNDSGTNVVTLWSDVRGTDVNYARQQTETLAPWLIPDFTNGLPVVDFGGFSVRGNTPNARGGWMWWSKGSKALRDVFTVASDTEDLDWNFTTLVETAEYGYAAQSRRGAPFVGSQDSYDPHFLRSERPNDGSARPGILLSNVAIYSSASVKVDGEDVSKSSVYPVGLHVVNIRTGMDAHGNCFANDRKQIYGGTRIGEFVAFTNEVPSRARSALNRMLMSKWLGGDKAMVHACGALSVANGATLELPYQTLAPTDSSEIFGSVSARSLRISSDAVFGSDSSFSGNMELVNGAHIVLPENTLTGGWALSVDRLVLSGGTVRMSFADGSVKPDAGTVVKLMSFKSVEGTATFQLELAEGRKARVVVMNDGLYATVYSAGFVLVVR